jgi:hypothetical protein
MYEYFYSNKYGFEKEYVNFLPEFIAVLKDVKPLMSANVRVKDYKKIEKICKYNKLFIDHSSYGVTRHPDKRLRNPVVVSKPTPNSSIFVYISRSRELIKEAKKCHWQNCFIDGKMVRTPPSKVRKFGKILGYPECCIEFAVNMEWVGEQRPLIYQLENTKSKFSLFCNNVFKYKIYYLSFHYPHSFDCELTINFCKKILKAIEEEEKDLAKKILYYLQLPILYFDMHNVIVFEGKKINNEVVYDDIIPIEWSRIVKFPNNSIFKKIKYGNKIRVFNKSIHVFRDDELLYKIEKKDKFDGFLIRFE